MQIKFTSVQKAEIRSGYLVRQEEDAGFVEIRLSTVNLLIHFTCENESIIL